MALVVLLVAVCGGALYAKGSFDSPLGQFPINESLATELLQTGAPLEDIPAAYHDDHLHA